MLRATIRYIKTNTYHWYFEQEKLLSSVLEIQYFNYRHERQSSESCAESLPNKVLNITVSVDYC